MCDNVNTKCLICGDELIQELRLREYKCDICGEKYISDYVCRNGHHICSACSLKKFYTIAKTVCMKTKSRNPVEIADQIMTHPHFTILGCKHYIIAPMALFTAYKNCGGKVNDFEKSLDSIRDSALLGQVSLCRVGGLCGVPLAAGRAMYATGPKSSPSEQSSIMTNKFSAECMREVLNLEYIGPIDCCKRNVFLTIFGGVKFIRDYLWVDLELPGSVKCRYSENNPRCSKEQCQLFAGKSMMKFL